MKITNIHSRVIDATDDQIQPVLDTISSKEDKFWPYEKWPRIRLSNGLSKGSIGGHGPIGYSISDYIKGELIEFEFNKPSGFVGIHRFEIRTTDDQRTELKHIIDMTANLSGLLQWSLAIRWLHDALIEDAFDKVESQFVQIKKPYQWNFWVKFLRFVLK